MITDSVTDNPDRSDAADDVGFRELPALPTGTRRNPSCTSRSTRLGRQADGRSICRSGKEYMQKMGYGDQPYIVYMHEDIGRRHIHIVSTCVNEKGEKIDDAYEWNRSMKACRELEQKFGLKQRADKKGTARSHLPQKSGLHARRPEAAGIQYPQERFHGLLFPVIRRVQRPAFLFQHRGKQVKGELGEVPYHGYHCLCR